MQPFFNAFALLTKQEKRQMLWLLPGVVFRALLEIAAIAFIAPFLSLISDPSSLEGDGILAWLYQFLGFSNTQPFLIFVGSFALGLIIFSNIFSVIITWALLRFSWFRDYSLSYRLLASYLHRPYLFFLSRNSADMGKNMLMEVLQSIRGVLIPGMQLLSNAVVAVAIMILLVVSNPLLALGMAVFLALAYVGIFGAVKKRLENVGKSRVLESKNRFQIVAEALGSIKENKLLARENFFLDRYEDSAKRYAHYMTVADIIAHIPRYLLDTLAFGGLVFILLSMLISGRSFDDAIPIIGLYAFAGYRLIPSLQQIYRSFSSMKFNAAAVDAIAADLDKNTLKQDDAERLAFNKEIKLERISFAYPDTQEAILSNLSLSIKKNSSVAFVGSTGSGKTTLIDLILGLLSPDEGSIVIDDSPIKPDNTRDWQKNLGYVPQSIYLTDASIAENIAFGIGKEQLDMDAVKKAAQIANLHNFVLDLPSAYDTVVGEHGVRLSGGQRQRIGLARALYHDPEVLILDEATSALDNVTEEAVFKAIKNLMGKKTLIMIAHRISTVQACDEIFMMDKGKIVASGNYQDLLGKSESFRALAQVAK